MDTELLSGSMNPFNILKIVKYRLDFTKQHPNYFIPEGLLVFCGSQGAGKTLSAVQYCTKCLDKYELSVFCTNVEIKDYPINCFYKRTTINENNIEKNIVEYFTLTGSQLVKKVISYYENGEQKTEITNFDVIGFNGRIVVEYNRFRLFERN